MAAPGVRMSVEQSLTLEASEIAIEGAAVGSGAELSANVIRLNKSVNLREDPQDFQFRHYLSKKG
jgi:hypothetical protein